MLRTAFEQQFLGPWLVVVPGLLIMFMVLSFNLLGDGIRDAIGRERRN
jgi:peptide/nickel transport system permease protein